MNKNVKGFLIFITSASIIMTMLIAMAVILMEPEPMETRLQNDLSIDSSASNYLKNVLYEVGIDEYVSVIKYAKNDNKYGFNDKGYIINKYDAEPIYVNITEKADFIKIIYKDTVLYEPGMTNGNIYDHILTNNELAEFKMYAEKDVKRILKDPDGAVFPLLDGWKYGKIDGEVVLQSYVDAHNSFGAVIRTDFQVKYKAGALVSLIFDSKEYVKY